SANDASRRKNYFQRCAAAQYRGFQRESFPLAGCRDSVPAGVSGAEPLNVPSPSPLYNTANLQKTKELLQQDKNISQIQCYNIP
ncbi:MAG: hypothetical protein IJ466_11280, partial [Clostridia bacterium]|nr:hypothetical protein [Clostridia bacterium]